MDGESAGRGLALGGRMLAAVGMKSVVSQPDMAPSSPVSHDRLGISIDLINLDWEFGRKDHRYRSERDQILR